MFQEGGTGTDHKQMRKTWINYTRKKKLDLGHFRRGLKSCFR